MNISIIHIYIEKTASVKSGAGISSTDASAGVQSSIIGFEISPAKKKIIIVTGRLVSR